MHVYLKLTWYFRREWRRYAIALATLLCVALLVMLPPRIAGQIVDAVAAGTLTFDQLLSAVGEIALVAVLIYVLRFIWRVALYGASYQLAALLRQRIHDHLISMPPELFQRHNTGDLMARATNDVTAVEMTAGEGVLSMVDGVMTGLVVLAVLTFTLSWKLTLLALLPWPIMSYFMWVYGNELHASFTRAQEEFSRVNDRVQQGLSGIRLIKALGGEARERAAFAAAAARAGNANLAVARTDAKYDPTIQLTMGSSFFLTVAGGAWFIQRGELSVGELTSFTMYLGYLIWPMFAYGWLLNIVERGSAAYTRIESLLAEQNPVPDKGSATELHTARLDIDISQFTYPGTAKPTLHDMHVTVPAGTTLGIVGHTGSGKTTLVRLLLRLYEAPQARILLGGKALADYRLAALHEHIAGVPQDPFLFSATIAENIGLGLPDAAPAALRRAAELACVAADIDTFPEGFDTLVGERGVTLSGGQKQRLAIARALLRNPPILVLDDALSAVDVDTETRILTYFRNERRGMTNIIVSHRLSAVMDAQSIIVLDHGRVAEQGTHRELLRQGGWYAQMFRYQQIERAVSEGR